MGGHIQPVGLTFAFHWLYADISSVVVIAADDDGITKYSMMGLTDSLSNFSKRVNVGSSP